MYSRFFNTAGACSGGSKRRFSHAAPKGSGGSSGKGTCGPRLQLADLPDLRGVDGIGRGMECSNPFGCFEPVVCNGNGRSQATEKVLATDPKARGKEGKAGGLAKLGAATTWTAFPMNGALQFEPFKLEEVFDETPKARTKIQKGLKSAILLRCVAGHIQFLLELDNFSSPSLLTMGSSSETPISSTSWEPGSSSLSSPSSSSPMYHHPFLASQR